MGGELEPPGGDRAPPKARAGRAAFLGRTNAADGEWAELLRRLPAAGILPDDPSLLERLNA